MIDNKYTIEIDGQRYVSVKNAEILINNAYSDGKRDGYNQGYRNGETDGAVVAGGAGLAAGALLF